MRRIINCNSSWLFFGPRGEEQNINVPHTWNAVDGQDGGNDYWRGTCTYEKTLPAISFDSAVEQVYLEFQGVNASCTVYLNDIEITDHDGGYSTFRVEIGKYLQAGQNENRLKVIVDNSVNDRVYPQKADFTFYGGIYRDVNLLIVNKAHFDLEYFGGSGVMATPQVKDGTADVRVQTYLSECARVGEGRYSVVIKLQDAEGKLVAEAAGNDVNLHVAAPHLWQGVEDPYLYRLCCSLYEGENLLDQVELNIGIRSYTFDPNKGFFLNGKAYPLRGVSRHQDRKGLGNAITKEHHLEDMRLIQEIGANTIRLAHYQHDQYFYDLCDEYGMVVWAEIPYISEHMPNGRANTVSQMKELIIQNYNHPSIVMWGLSNEITISTKDKQDMLSNHHELNELCHSMDPTRLTTLACYAVCSHFNRSAHISDIVAWNLYLGWYVPGLFLNDLWIKFFHLIYPKRCLGYSEYGCEGMPNLHSSKPKRGDHTEEYQAIYHEYMLSCFERHPYLWGTYVWNMFDFAADARDQGGEAGMNHKGLITFDRQTKKDSFYIYKAWWSKEAVLHICSKRYRERTGSSMQVKVYSNQPEVKLFVNGSFHASSNGKNHVFTFEVPLTDEIVLEAQAGALKDSAVFKRVERENQAYILQKSAKNSQNWV